MGTFSGGRFWPLDPRPEDINIYDVAHSLAMSCRFNGHCIRFYSIAEHSCHIYDKTSKENKRWAILHDAPESFMGDMVNPLKKFMPNFRTAEDRIMDLICERWGMPKEMPEEVHRLDRAIVRDEIVNMKTHGDWNIPPEGIGADIQCWSPERAEEEFLSRCKKEEII